MLSLKTTNKSLHATYLCSSDSFGLKIGKKFVSVGRKRFSSSGSRSNDVTILQVFFAPQVMSRNYVRVPAHLLQKPPKKLAPAASSPFKVRRSNRCLERASESAFIKVRAIFPAAQEYARRQQARRKTSREPKQSSVKSVRGRVWIPAAGGRCLCPVTGRSSKNEARGNGQLGSADLGIRPGAPGRHRIDHRHHPAPVEDVGLCRGQHHHRRGHVRGPVDVVRLPEHRADPV